MPSSQVPRKAQVRNPIMGRRNERRAARPATPVTRAPATLTARSNPSDRVKSPEFNKNLGKSL